MAHQAGAVHLCQRALDVVVGVFHATVGDIRHMAVGAGYSPLAMDALQRGLIAGVLGLEDGGLGQRVDVVGIAHLIVVLLRILQREAVFPGEGEVLVLLGRLGIIVEIILHVALGAHKRAHLVVRGLVHVLAHAGKGFAKCRAGDVQVHGLGIMAVAAADGVHDIGAPLGPVGLVEFSRADFLHQTRHIRAFAGPAGAGLVGAVVELRGKTGAKDFAMVLQGVKVAAGRIVVP